MTRGVESVSHASNLDIKFQPPNPHMHIVAMVLTPRGYLETVESHRRRQLSLQQNQGQFLEPEQALHEQQARLEEGE